MSRAVVVRMRRRAPGQEVRRYRERIPRPQGQELRGKIAAWAESVAGRVGDPWPDLPDGVDDRPADVREPLVMIADLAGGDWPRGSPAMPAPLSSRAQVRMTKGIPTRLLADLRAVFGDAEALWTEPILDRLRKLEEAPWVTGTGTRYGPRPGERLEPYGIKSGEVRKGEANRQGYPRPPAGGRAGTRASAPPLQPDNPTPPLASHVGM